GYGADLVDTNSLQIQGSVFTNNAAGNVRAQFDLQGSYSYSLTNSLFTSAAADNVVVRALAGSEGSTMNCLSQSNTFNNSVGGSAGLRVDWNGVFTGTVDHSAFTGTGGSNTGAYISNNSTTASTTVAFTNNSFLGTGGTDTGFRLETA